MNRICQAYMAELLLVVRTFVLLVLITYLKKIWKLPHELVHQLPYRFTFTVITDHPSMQQQEEMLLQLAIQESFRSDGSSSVSDLGNFNHFASVKFNLQFLHAKLAFCVSLSFLMHYL